MTRCTAWIALVLAAGALAGCARRELDALNERNSQLTADLAQRDGQLRTLQTSEQALRSLNVQIQSDLAVANRRVKELENERAGLVEDLRLARIAAGQLPATRPAAGPGLRPTTVQQVEATQWRLLFTLAGDLGFDSGKAQLKDAAKPELDKVVVLLVSQEEDRFVLITGHTDADPIRKSDWPSNQALSEARAQAVANYLAAKGVAKGRLVVVGWGDSKPLVSERIAADKARNRRVEIRVDVQ